MDNVMDPRYFSQMGYPTNVLEYNPNTNMIEMVKRMMMGWLFKYPHLEQPPPGYSMYDFERMRENARLAGMVRNQYKSVNPVALNFASMMMRKMGIENAPSLLMNPSGELTSLGSMVGQTYNQIFQTQGTAWYNMGEMQNTLYTTMKGLTLRGDPGAIYRPGTGISMTQSDRLLSDLMYGTYKDSFMTKTRGLWNYQDIMEISRIGRDYGVFRGARQQDLPGRIQGFGSVIQNAMTTFNTPSKEEALRALIEITGGSIDIADTGKMKDVLSKIKNIGESANISVQVLKAVLERGSEVSKQLGMTGLTGVNINMTAISQLRMIGGKLPIPMGEKEIQMRWADYMTQVAGSDAGQRISGIVGVMRNLGMEPPTKFLKTGRMMTTSDIEDYQKQIIPELMKKYNLTEDQAKQRFKDMMVLEAGKGTEYITDKYKNYFSLMAGKATMEELFSATKNKDDQASIGRILSDTASNKDYETIRSRYYIHMKNRGIDQNVAHTNFEALKNRKNIARLTELEERASIDRRNKEESLRTLEKQNKPLEEAMKRLGYTGDLGYAIRAFFPKYNTLLGEANVQDAVDILDFTYKRGYGEKELDWATRMMGGSLRNVTDIKDLLGTNLEGIGKYTGKDLQRITEDYSKIVRARGSELTLRDIVEEGEKTGKKISTREALAIMKTLSPDAWKNISGIWKDKPREWKGDKQAYIKMLKEKYGETDTNKLMDLITSNEKWYLRQDTDDYNKMLKNKANEIERGMKDITGKMKESETEKITNFSRRLIGLGDQFEKASKGKTISLTEEEKKELSSYMNSRKDEFTMLGKIYGTPYALQYLLSKNKTLRKYAVDEEAMSGIYNVVMENAKKQGLDFTKYFGGDLFEKPKEGEELKNYITGLGVKLKEADVYKILLGKPLQDKKILEREEYKGMDVKQVEILENLKTMFPKVTDKNQLVGTYVKAQEELEKLILQKGLGAKDEKEFFKNSANSIINILQDMRLLLNRMPSF